MRKCEHENKTSDERLPVQLKRWQRWCLVACFIASCLTACRDPIENESGRDFLKFKQSFIRLKKVGWFDGPQPIVASLDYDRAFGNIVFSIIPSHPFFNNLMLYKFSLNNLQERTVIVEKNIGSGDINDIAISSDGIYMAVGKKEGTVEVFKDNKVFFSLSSKGEVTSLVINDGRKLAVGTANGWVIIFDLVAREVINERKLFDKKVVAFDYHDEILWVGGLGGAVYGLDFKSGDVLQSLKIQGSIEKLTSAIGLKPCTIPITNKVVVVPEMKFLLTTHGGDYCTQTKVVVWDLKTHKKIKEIKEISLPVYNAIWVPRIETAVLIDFGLNVWKLSLNNMALKGPFNIEKRIVLEHSSGQALGDMRDLILLPDSTYGLAGGGSYFKGGTGLYLMDFAKETFSVCGFWELGYIKDGQGLNVSFNDKCFN